MKQIGLVLILSLYHLDLLVKLSGFQFIPPTITVIPLTINAPSNYIFAVNRQFDSTLAITKWQSEPVPANSDIIVVFPSEYNLALSAPGCQFVLINGNLVTLPIICSVTGNSLKIQGAIPNVLAISEMSISLNNVLNPSPALTTGTFVIKIGNDNSANILGQATVTLEADQLVACQINFNPAIVNTTGSMIVKITPKNVIPSTGSIWIKFPPSLQWQKDLSNNHPIPISGSLPCSGVSPNVKSGISCTGVTSSQEIRVTNLLTTQTTAVIQISINGLFSPPTTQPVDTLLISTHDGLWMIDKCTSTIAGLQPQPLPTLSISPTSVVMAVNSAGGLRFDFTVTDTLSKDDYFQIEFPVNSKISFITGISSFILAGSNSYNSLTRTLSIYQAASNPLTFAGKASFVTFLSYTAPPSKRTTEPIVFSIKNNMYLKARGQGTIAAVYKNYSMTGDATYKTVSATTSYTLVIPLTDTLLATAMMIIKVPTQLALSTACPIFTPSATVLATPPCSILGQTITITKLTASATIPPQSLSINIPSLQNPASAKTLDNWLVQIYYTDDVLDLTAIGTLPGIVIVPGILPQTQVSIALSSQITIDKKVNYTIGITANHTVPINGFVLIVFPLEIGVIQPTSCRFQYATGMKTTPCTYIAPSTIEVSILQSIPSGAKFTVVMNQSFSNPISTRPTSSLTITTKNSAKEGIDTLSSGVFITVSTPRPFTSRSVTPASLKNQEVTSYVVKFTQLAAYETGSYFRVTFPIEIKISSTTKCINTDNSNTLVCTPNILGNYIDIVLPFPNTTAQISISLSDIINAESYKPSSPFLFSTFTPDNFGYSISTTNTPISIVNNLPSVFKSLSYNFGSKQLATTSSSLTLAIQMSSVLALGGKLTINLDWQIITNPPGLTCSSSQFTPICILVSSSLVQISSAAAIPSLFSITIGTLTNPSVLPVNNLTLRSYAVGDYLINQQSAIKFLLDCKLPCRTCKGSDDSACLSCYAPSTNISPNVFLFNSQCLSICPPGTYNSTFICLACDANCMRCSMLATNCTGCQSGSYLLNQTDSITKISTSSCVLTCPSLMYANNTVTPPSCMSCVSPCVTCVSYLQCSMCINSQYLYGTSCVLTCPSDITITNQGPPIMKCDNCSNLCKTCLNTITNCMSCNIPKLLYLNQCEDICPTGSIPNPVNTLCLLCVSPCKQCSITVSNCTVCLVSFPLFFSQSCYTKCPQLTFSKTSSTCELCSSIIPSINCNNCSSISSCLTCNVGYVFFRSNNSCLSSVPEGYVNISGIAEPCEGDCLTCSVLTTTCTSCRLLFLQGNQCLGSCPNGKIGINRLCQACTTPCATCTITQTSCTSCILNYFLSANLCLTQCPAQTYPKLPDRTCLICLTPCLNCISASQCISCQTGYLIDSTCVQNCPDGKVGILGTCQNCISPCLTCQTSTTRCLSCQNPLFFYEINHSCIASCPADITVSNGRSCLGCVNPCQTCVISVSTCVTCISGKLLNNNACLNTCPNGKYGQNGICKDCSAASNCNTCSSATECTSCNYPFLYYQKDCISKCPADYGVIIDNTCTQCLQNCANCSSTNDCYNCSLNHILFNNTCITKCPTGYTLTLNVTSRQYYCNYTANPALTSALSFTSIFPLPFTIIGGIIFIACFMSKLQNQNTYLIGLAYCIFGILQVGSIAFLLYQYWSQTQATDQYSEGITIMIVAGMGLIYLINVVGFCIQTPLLLWDIQFRNWLHSSSIVANTGTHSLIDSQTIKNNHHQGRIDEDCCDCCKCCGHRFSFAAVTVISLLLSYKFKLILFTRLFNFECLSARLQNIQQFRLFNLLSFLGMVHEGQILYVCFVLIGKFPFAVNSVIFMAAIDVIIIAIINVILALIASHKEADFFQKKYRNLEHIHGRSKLREEHLGQADSVAKLKFQQSDDDEQISLDLSQEEAAGQVSKSNLKPTPLKTKKSNIFDGASDAQQDLELGADKKIRKSILKNKNNDPLSPRETKSPIISVSQANVAKSVNSKPGLNKKALTKSGLNKESQLKKLRQLDIDQIKPSSLKTSKISKLQMKQAINDNSVLSLKTSKIQSPTKKNWVEVSPNINQRANPINENQFNHDDKRQQENKTLKKENTFLSRLKQDRKQVSQHKKARKLYGKKENRTQEQVANGNQEQQHAEQEKVQELPIQLRDFDQESDGEYQLTERRKKENPSDLKLKKVKPMQLNQLNEDEISEISITNHDNHQFRNVTKLNDKPNLNYQEKKNQSYQSLLPFVHEDGQLKQKPNFIQQKSNCEIAIQHDASGDIEEIIIPEQKIHQPLKTLHTRNQTDARLYGNFILQQQHQQGRKNQNITTQLQKQASLQIVKSKQQQSQQNQRKIQQPKQQKQEEREGKFEPIQARSHSQKYSIQQQEDLQRKINASKTPQIYRSNTRLNKINEQQGNINRKIIEKEEFLRSLKRNVQSLQKQIDKSVKRQESKEGLRKSGNNALKIPKNRSRKNRQGKMKFQDQQNNSDEQQSISRYQSESQYSDRRPPVVQHTGNIFSNKEQSESQTEQRQNTKINNKIPPQIVQQTCSDKDESHINSRFKPYGNIVKGTNTVRNSSDHMLETLKKQGQDRSGEESQAYQHDSQKKQFQEYESGSGRNLSELQDVHTQSRIKSQAKDQNEAKKLYYQNQSKSENSQDKQVDYQDNQEEQLDQSDGQQDQNSDDDVQGVQNSSSPFEEQELIGSSHHQDQNEQSKDYEKYPQEKFNQEESHSIEGYKHKGLHSSQQQSEQPHQRIPNIQQHAENIINQQSTDQEPSMTNTQQQVSRQSKEIGSLSQLSHEVQYEQAQKPQSLLVGEKAMRIDQQEQRIIKRNEQAQRFQFPTNIEINDEQGIEYIQRKQPRFKQLSPQQQQSVLQLLRKNGQTKSNANMPPLKIKRKLPKEELDDFGINRIRAIDNLVPIQSTSGNPLPIVQSHRRSKPLDLPHRITPDKMNDELNLQKRKVSGNHPIYIGKINRQFVQASQTERSFPDQSDKVSGRIRSNLRNAHSNLDIRIDNKLQQLRKKEQTSTHQLPFNRRDPFNNSQQLHQKESSAEIMSDWGKRFDLESRMAKNLEDDSVPNQPMIREDSHLPQLKANYQSRHPLMHDPPQQHVESQRRSSRSGSRNKRGKHEDSPLEKIYRQRLDPKKR